MIPILFFQRLPIVALSLTSFCSPDLFASDSDLRFYTREVRIQTSDYTGKLTLCPLYDDRELAITTRWDDSNPRHYRMLKLMGDYGFHGTLYMNHGMNGEKSLDFDQLKALDADLGAHSMTHPRLATNLSINQMFWEVAEIRAILESERDQPINSYCFSDGNFRNRARPFMQGEIAKSLQRVGYTHNVYARFAESIPDELDAVSTVSPISAGDKNPSMKKFDQRFEQIMSDPNEWYAEAPCVSIGVHVWLYNDESWGEMEEIYKKYANRENWWYCDQSDYAAYQKLLKHTSWAVTDRKDNEVTYEIRVPYASDLGSNSPLSLRFSVPNSRVFVDGELVMARSDDEGTIFHLLPPDFAQIPREISYFRNLTNQPSQPAGSASETSLRAWLYLGANDQLQLQISNRSSVSVEEVRLSYILPPKYENPLAENLVGIASGETLKLERPLKVIGSGEYLWGVPYLLCQIDYLANGQAERVFVSTFDQAVQPPYEAGFRDDSFVSGIFTDLSISERAAELSEPGAAKLASLAWYGPTEMERLMYNRYVLATDLRLSDELESAPSGERYYFIIRELVSDQGGVLVSRSFARLKGVYLNGRKVPKSERGNIPIQPGLNRFVTIHKVNNRTDRKRDYFTYEVRSH
ncbi:polysaccharide deacetylase family protein [Puniceicoccus vermicola]|uniref:Polysaccharide deacetylase family protein n=1 Tax=Puniceicoccus vermicola TaxID=388746 RepID=A0A7X1AXH2_9BACT|nr:polysaccharide deacetylase family protein [Puniceicoccus vermicola]MBC2601737.1 polysaccharide deacetylase family protein [Puniceicoccus vermicola]